MSFGPIVFGGLFFTKGISERLSSFANQFLCLFFPIARKQPGCEEGTTGDAQAPYDLLCCTHTAEG